MVSASGGQDLYGGDENLLREAMIEEDLAALDALAERVTNAWVSEKSRLELLEELREGVDSEVVSSVCQRVL
jgi:hypothetical protein